MNNSDTLGFISIDRCDVGSIYELNSRNLRFGVYTANKTFVGIRRKFDDIFLDKELHGAAGGTAYPTKKICVLPDGISHAVYLCCYDTITGAEIEFDKPIIDGGKGWYFVETGISSKEINPSMRSNTMLLDYLAKIVV